MNWLPLRKNNVPIIDRQIDKAVELYKSLQAEILDGQISGVQKISELDLSIKKRIQEMDDFYNQNCFDQRVRFLQNARMKLANLIYLSPPQQNEIVALPWNSGGSVNRQSFGGNKNVTPRKIGKNDDVSADKNMKKEIRKSPLLPNRSPLAKPQMQIPNKREENYKVNLSSRAPRQDEPEYFALKKSERGFMNPQQGLKPSKSSRKMQAINSKSSRSQTFQMSGGTNPSAKQPIAKNKNTGEISKMGVKAPRTLTDNQNNSSMKKLNDLIFTIKMTKEEYDDFVKVKKMLNTNPTFK